MSNTWNLLSKPSSCPSPQPSPNSSIQLIHVEEKKLCLLYFSTLLHPILSAGLSALPERAPGTQPPLAACTATVHSGPHASPSHPEGRNSLSPSPCSILDLSPLSTQQQVQPPYREVRSLMPYSTHKPHSSVARSQSPHADPSPVSYSSLLCSGQPQPPTVPQIPKAASFTWLFLPNISA